MFVIRIRWVAKEKLIVLGIPIATMLIHAILK